MMNLIRANCELLSQGIELLTKHSDGSYQACDTSTYGSGLGPHFRHVLDHYRSFLRGLESGLIDYDNRKRKTAVEKDRSCAIAEIEAIEAALRGSAIDANKAVEVRVSVSTAGGEEGRLSRSSLGRELQFLVSHTVHHYALIAIASRMQGVFPEDSFGVAPSTLKFLETASQ